MRKNFLFLGVFLLAFSTNSLAESDQSIEYLKGQVSKYEGIVRTHLSQLNTCRDRCIRSCKAACPPEEPENPQSRQARQDCFAGCTQEKCDAGQCQAYKSGYDKYKGHLDDYKEQLGVAEKQAREEGDPDESVTGKINKAKKKTNTMAYLGVGTTAFLGYKAYKCCSATSCPMCAVWTGMAGLAGAQTLKMFKQRNKFNATELALCANNPNDLSCQSECQDNPQNPACDPDCTGGADDPPRCQSYCVQNPSECEPPPSCEEIVDCEPVITIVDPPEKPPKPVSPPPWCASGTGCFQGIDPLVANILDEYKPKNGWPPNMPNENIFDQEWLDEHMTPEQKQKVQKALAQVRSQNADYKDQAGLTDAEQGFSGESEAGAPAVDENGNPAPPSGTDAFTGSDRSSAGEEGGSSGSQRGGQTENLLAKQMQDMLKKFRNKNKPGANNLGGKSVNFGDDIVGVAEDNIFMMAHRRHRNLDEEKNIFIRKDL